MIDHCALLTGPPRSGTFLACALLGRLQGTVSLSEPLPMGRLSNQGRQGALTGIIDFLQASRSELLSEGRGRSKQRNGEIPTNAVDTSWNGNDLRKISLEDGYLEIDKPLPPDFLLVVKHNEAFTALLPELSTLAPVFAIVRNPIATLASWNTVAIRAQEGRAPIASRLDPDLEAKLAGTADRLDRQLAILDWTFSTYLTHLPAASIITYEDMISSGGRALSPVTLRAENLKADLVSANTPTRYGDTMQWLCERLLRSDGAYWSIYPRSLVSDLMDPISRSNAFPA